MLVIQRRTGANMLRKKSGHPVLKESVIVESEKPWGKLERAREFAFSLYEKRGYVLGNELQVWLDAENKAKKK